MEKLTNLIFIPKQKSGEAQVTRHKGEWTYFSRFSFLENQFTPRKSGENFIDKEEHEAILND